MKPNSVCHYLTLIWILFEIHVRPMNEAILALQSWHEQNENTLCLILNLLEENIHGDFIEDLHTNVMVDKRLTDCFL